MPDHSSEPWKYHCGWIVDATGKMLFPTALMAGEVIEHDPDMRRILACVNAMAGIEDPEKWVQEAKDNEIVEWDWEQCHVTLSNGVIRPMSAAERAPRITDAKSGEEITHVISYRRAEHRLYRYTVDSGGRCIKDPDNKGLMMAVALGREVKIEVKP